ncbi:MAG: excinuclease ABC subunit B [Candidatus Firestonebacteria bacterium RIFOXYC2_FULL_39_67]|nr:MAG: excinuclease ABC subunit B [Candidatus Firestonebacteria bacterium RIFOXYD2_FULL_39_29]OGF56627.1 MAG: excinuclease ABC subunit B [Candidatus Firestonebacteria bacterium RIFOXYC2_FULL_39_67]
MSNFKLVSEYTPKGDQPEAIRGLISGLERGKKHQTLLGVTGSGKTFTVANVIEKVNKPTIIISHNKTLAAQLYGEFKSFFPENAVEYFVSYYDYYQPEAYIAQTDTYIEKDSSINDEIDKLRHSATSALLTRRDTIVVASVSCIYGIGSPDTYSKMQVVLKKGMEFNMDTLIKKLVEIQYMRNDTDFYRGTFRLRGDILDIFPSASDTAIRVEFNGNTIEKLSEIDAFSGSTLKRTETAVIFPAAHWVTPPEELKRAAKAIEEELEIRLKFYKDAGKILEMQRIEQRTRHDIEMILEIGTCKGIENYSRHLDGRKQGEPPYTLIDYLPADGLIIADESHITLPQVRGMFEGDKARKTNLVDYGFRLPSALDNRPLYFKEFDARIPQIIYVSATPADFEIKESEGKVIEQVIRPTGLMDPEVTIKPATGQVDDLIAEIKKVVEKGGRVLVTTLTKKSSEDLSEYLKDINIRAKYLHSDIETIERVKILQGLRRGEFDVLIGINLLREGLDLPEVMMVAILDADKEGFLRSKTSLVQTIGRAARNVEGRVIMYADKMTKSIKFAIDETNRRRAIQAEYNKKHGITPATIKKEIRNILESIYEADYYTVPIAAEGEGKYVSSDEFPKLISDMEKEMHAYASKMEFEKAAAIRDKVRMLKSHINKMKEGGFIALSIDDGISSIERKHKQRRIGMQKAKRYNKR